MPTEQSKPEQMLFLEEDLTAIVADQVRQIKELEARLKQKDDQIEALSLDLAIFRGESRMIFPLSRYRDPLQQMLDREARSCKGCVFRIAEKVFDKELETCKKGRNKVKKCSKYKEAE